MPTARSARWPISGREIRRRGAGAGLALVLALAAASCVATGPDAGPGPDLPDGPAARALDLTGELRTHDPALLAGADGEAWLVFSTGDERVGNGAIQVRTSPDGLDWADAGTLWTAATEPAWVRDAVPGVTNFWAPEVYEHDGTHYLYYTASTFGSNRSAIGLLTNAALDPADPASGWVDHGEVLRSAPGEDNFNAIDPAIVEDADGTPWMAFGSYWGGIHLVQLAWPSGKPADPQAPPQQIASRIGAPNAIEAPALIHRDGWFYLLVSRDACCRGSDSTYNMAVGRSRAVTGPYVDRAGVAMTSDGGEPLLATRDDMIGPGGESVSGGHLAFHYYDAAAGGDFRLAIRELAWDADGWPIATTADEQAADADDR
ncbi:arabinan endo-1,5-alpha-L-arabinosidase [Cellulomonas timonensis]|uniref:arabinan endo-1,5-alpha-L-arabinosidase n=1 Tax=Cellulomonas timonensis TaxID=1689271 RepID=UPI0009ED2CF5|nr:arabinan endo-1,5-alpha-L-arabinosidase [Cellulomonas timonensis]